MLHIFNLIPLKNFYMKPVWLFLLFSVATAALANEKPPQPVLKPSELKAVNTFIKSQEKSISRNDVAMNRTENTESRMYLLGDVNNDKIDDLVVSYALLEGNRWTLFIAVFSKPTMKYISHTRVGAKGYRGVELKKIHNNLIELSVKYYCRTDPLCCPSVPGVSKYSISQGKFIEESVQINCSEE